MKRVWFSVLGVVMGCSEAMEPSGGDGADAGTGSAAEGGGKVDDGRPGGGADGEAGGDGSGGGDGTPPGGEAGDGEAGEGGDSGDGDDGADDGNPPGNPGDVVRFAVLGDGGEGNDAQFAVAAAVEQVCADRGCEFALYLGDNFYDVGVDSTMDVQFQDKFEMPYMDLEFPFYITLGNHDYGALGNQWDKSQYQVEYSNFSDKWNLPSEFYSFDVGPVTFISLDTSRLFWDKDVEPQAAFLQETLAASDRPWSIVFGHHPYISNGSHGNAGNYEGLPIPIVSGETVEEFFSDEVCGKATVYLCGHDHNRQWHQPTCGTEFIVSGAAAKTTGFENRDGNPAPRWQDDTKEGFAWIEVSQEGMTVAFYDLDANLDYEQTVPKP